MSTECLHRHLHPGRYEGSWTVCLDCRTEVLVFNPGLRTHDREAERYERGRALAAIDMKTAPLWPASATREVLLRPHDDPDFYPTPPTEGPTE